ncbi:MAG: TonB-dependent receptor [Steroidobacteraceae bacterium]
MTIMPSASMRTAVALLMALVTTVSTTAEAAQDEAASLRAELDAVRSEYTSRLAALEQRILQLEQAAATAPPDSGAPAPVAAQATASAFNPATSVILTGNYAALSADPASYAIAGFIPSGGETGPPERGFNLAESELTLAANVDPYLYANLTAAIGADNEIGVEEAYLRSLALPAGFGIKAGRFFSALGYLNEVHAHAWDFVDQPLVYQALLAGQRSQDGVQLKWIAPSDLFIEIGAELGNGAAFPGTRRNRNGVNDTTLFAHVGGDIRDSISWQSGLSWADLRTQDRQFADVDLAGDSVLNAFTGRSRLAAVDAVFKWSPVAGNTSRQVKLQAEYLQRRESGTLTYDIGGLALPGDYASRQSGWYLQAVYQFKPRWRAGLRYDALDSGTTRLELVDSGQLALADFPALLAASPVRYTLMLDWNPSEFSRLRAQFALDEARASERDRQLLLQYILSIGAHGAHKF